MKKSFLITSPSLLCLAAAAWAGETTQTASTDPAAPYSASGSVLESDSLGEPVRPCLCHGAYAGSESDKPLSFNLTAAYDSSYICRGLDVGDNSFQITGTIDYRITDRITWTSSALYRDVTEVDFNELNLYTGLFFSFGKLSIGPSLRWWHLEPNGGEVDVYDLGLQALYKLGQVSLTAGYYYDTESEGTYFEFGASSSFKIHERVRLVPSAQISHTDGWLVPGLQGLNYLDLRVSLPIEVVENVTLTPYVGGVVMLEALEATQDDKFIGGVALSVSF